MDKREELLTGNLWRLMIRLSIPGILGMLVLSVNGLVDAFFVAHLVGVDAFAGVSYTLPLLTLNAAVTGMVSAGSAVIYSKAIGSESEDVKGSLFKHLLVLIAGCSILLITIGLCLGNTLLGWLNVPVAQMGYASAFYHTTIIGAFFPLFGLCTSGLMRAEGHIRKAMVITIVSMVINAAINPVLIKYAGLGVAGSAMASIIAMMIYSALTFYHFYSGKGHLRIDLHVSLNKDVFKDILQTGLPSFYMQINGFLRQFVLFKLAAYHSTPEEVLAFSGIYRLFSFAAIPVFGMLQAFGPVVGVNFGAKQYTRTAEAISVFRSGTILLMLCMALPCLLFPEGILGLLLTAPGSAAMAAPYFRMVIGVLLLTPLASTSVVFLQSTGRAKLAAKFTLRREFLIFIPVILMSVYLFGYAGIYYGLLLENIIYISIVYWVTRHHIHALTHQPLQATI